MVLTGSELQERVNEFFPKIPPAKIGPGSYDLTVSPRIKVFGPGEGPKVEGTGTEWLLDAEVKVGAGTFIIAHTNEVVRIPPGYAGLMLLRSSMGRIGWLHAFAGYVDPGFEGQLVFELYAATNTILVPNSRIAQLVIFKGTNDDAAYKGRYHGQRGLTMAYEGAFAHGAA